jgi:alpha-tubulin suppressor-like RCC1 family protein
MNSSRLTALSRLLAVAVLAGCSDGSGPGSPHSELRYQQVVTGDALTCALTTSRTTYCWGSAEFSTDSTPKLLATPEPLVMLAVGSGNYNQALCGLTETGKIYCWGYYLGGTDIGSVYGDGESPVLMADSFQFTTLAAGNGHVCGIATTGETVCWGSYLYGKRGQGGAYPVDCSNGGSCFADLKANLVLGGENFTRLAAGEQQTCGITSTKNLYCWGDSLAAGSPRATVEHADSLCWPSTACTTIPGPIVSLTGIKTVAAGGPHTCAVTDSGVLYCWGVNYYGEVGNGLTTDQPTPLPISIGESVSLVTAGAYTTCALGVSGGAWCWGVNESGQAGFTPGPNVVTPKKVLFAHRFVQLSAGTSHICGISEEGALYCWGANYGAQLGNGSRTPLYTPTRVREPHSP